MQCLFDKVNVQTYEDGAVILSAGPKEHQDLHIVLQGQVPLVDSKGEEIAVVELWVSWATQESCTRRRPSRQLPEEQFRH
eukprot:Skav205513  [mRNA]  locus=scaffold231:239745:246442:- [translate_table: standard]